jgi:type IV pilus assembly protein PilE
MARQRGFTLIELMVVVAIIAVLAIIAVSSYKEQVHKSRRTTAFNDIAQLQLQLERWRAENPTYCKSGVGGCITYTISGTYPVMPTNTYYTYPLITAIGANETTYTLTATPKGDQLGDRCGVLCALPPGGTPTATCGTTKPLWANSDCN